MISEKYIKRLRDMILPALGEDGGAFIFGSAIRKERFGDVDVAIWCLSQPTTTSKAADLQEMMDESTFPYFVDIINVDTTSDYFYNELVEVDKLWLSSEKNFPPRKKPS